MIIEIEMIFARFKYFISFCFGQSKKNDSANRIEIGRIRKKNGNNRKS